VFVGKVKYQRRVLAEPQELIGKELSQSRGDAELAELLFEIFDLQNIILLLRIKLMYGRIK